MRSRLLLLEDDHVLSVNLCKILELEGYEIARCYTVKDFFVKFEELSPDVVILDINIAGEELTGLDILEKIQEIDTGNVKTIIISADTSRENIARAVKLGAFNFIEKNSNFDIDRFLLDIQQALSLKTQEDSNINLQIENIHLRKQLSKSVTFVAHSPKMNKLKKQISRLARANVNILISGETGTGKEIIAKQIYSSSDRVGGPFEIVNCSAISEHLLESELFGHARGAFTGAHKAKKGYFELCNNGFLVLDEFHHLNLSAQAKILRAIEYNVIQVVGARSKKVNTRVIFSTNENIQQLLRKDLIRKDLYYRIEGSVINIPTLKERGKDIIYIAEHYIKEFSQQYNNILDYDLNEIKNDILDYDWPGNVRELRNFCEHLTINSKIITNKLINKYINRKKNNRPMLNLDNALDDYLQIDNLPQAIAFFEKEYLKYHLEKNNNKTSRTALAIGVERTTLYKKIKKYGLN